MFLNVLDELSPGDERKLSELGKKHPISYELINDFINRECETH